MKLNTEFMIEAFKASLSGIPVTLGITVVSLMISMPLALMMAIKKINSKGPLSFLINTYVSIVRSTPMVLQILLLYSLLPSFLNFFIKQVLKIDFNIFKIPAIYYAYAVFSLNTTAILSEVFRSALLTVDKGQLEAGLSIGLGKFLTYIRIIIPQALVVALPNICNVTVGLLKSSSLAFFMTVQDITAIAKLKAAYAYNYIEAYSIIFILYIILCTMVQLIFKYIEVQIHKRR
ncbi:MAG: ABC transporter permease subunit [Lachnospiraceae bacterium]|nr:MAG: ABC transporter permease subunit [Lachnospiraceae bacterium]